MIVRAAVILVTGLLLAACSGNEGRQTLVVYSPHGKEMLAHYEKEFEKEYPSIDVRWLDMGSQDAYDRIRTERANPQADIWWGAPMITFAKAEAEGLLEAYTPSWSDAIPVSEKSAGDFWYGTFMTPEVIMYNSRLVSTGEAPADWDELLEPKWKDKIIIRYPLASGTMRAIFGAIIQRELRRTGSVEYGFEWLRRLDANTKSYVADPTQLYLKIAREEGAVSVWNLPDVVIQTNVNNYPFGYVIPTNGTPLITDCIAIVKGTQRRKEAELFYEFVTSQEALIEQATVYYRIPARTDIPADQLPDWITRLNIKPMEVDWKLLDENEKTWMKRWDSEVKGKGRP